MRRLRIPESLQGLAFSYESFRRGFSLLMLVQVTDSGAMLHVASLLATGTKVIQMPAEGLWLSLPMFACPSRLLHFGEVSRAPRSPLLFLADSGAPPFSLLGTLPRDPNVRPLCDCQSGF